MINTPQQDIILEDIDDKRYNLRALNNQWLLVINSASACGFSGQISELIDQQEKIKCLNLTVIIMPSNDFSQEPLRVEELKKKYTYRKKGPFIVCKPCIINGDNQHPLYRQLAHQSHGIFMQKRILWNFTKFIISPHQVQIKRLASWRSIEYTLRLLGKMQAMLEINK